MLVITNFGEKCTYKKRISYEEQFSKIRTERKLKMTEIDEREHLIEQLRQETDCIRQKVRDQQEMNEMQLKRLDEELIQTNAEMKKRIADLDDLVHKADVRVKI